MSNGDFEVKPEPIKGFDDHSLLLRRIRQQLNRWAARYAPSPHAKNDVRETNLLIQEIDEYLLKE
jgi:hypothetical protein